MFFPWNLANFSETSCSFSVRYHQNCPYIARKVAPSNAKTVYFSINLKYFWSFFKKFSAKELVQERLFFVDLKTPQCFIQKIKTKQKKWFLKLVGGSPKPQKPLHIQGKILRNEALSLAGSSILKQGAPLKSILIKKKCL